MKTCEWISGWALVDEIARTLRLETSGDVLRKVKNVGADDLRLNKIVRLIPMEERVEAIRVEEMLQDGSDLESVDARVVERTKGNKLEHLEDLRKTILRIAVSLGVGMLLAIPAAPTVVTLLKSRLTVAGVDPELRTNLVAVRVDHR